MDWAWASNIANGLATIQRPSGSTGALCWWGISKEPISAKYETSLCPRYSTCEQFPTDISFSYLPLQWLLKCLDFQISDEIYVPSNVHGRIRWNGLSNYDSTIPAEANCLRFKIWGRQVTIWLSSKIKTFSTLRIIESSFVFLYNQSKFFLRWGFVYKCGGIGQIKKCRQEYSWRWIYWSFETKWSHSYIRWLRALLCLWYQAHKLWFWNSLVFCHIYKFTIKLGM